jgi:hypothetical protein
MDLFKVEGTLVVPTEHALLISPYKDIWDNDEDPTKANAKRDFAYIELNCSYKKSNPFKGYADDIRKVKVGEAVYKEDYSTFEESELIVEGMELYERLRVEASPTLQYFLSAKSGAEKMMNWLDNFDMSEVNPRNGAPLYKPREITSALKDTYDVMKTLNALEEKVNEQLFEFVRTKGGKEINYFEK